MTDSLNKLNNLFSYFESKETSFQLAMINNFPGFIVYVKYLPVYIAAKAIASNDPVLTSKIIIERSIKLLEDNTVKKYRNVNDSALAAYLLLLSETSVQSAEKMIGLILSKNLPNLWWTNFMIKYVQVSVLTSEVKIETESAETIPYRTKLVEKTDLEPVQLLSNSIKFT